MQNRTLNILSKVFATGAMTSLAACGTSSSNGSSTTSTSAPATSAPSPTLTAPLAYAPTGSVTLSWSPQTHKVTADVHMADFAPGSAHALHIHSGSCAAPGGVLVAFPDVTADGAGAVNASVTASAPSPTGLPSHNAYFNIHLGNTHELSTTLGFTPIGCANLPPHGSSESVHLAVGPPPQVGDHPSGSTTITFNAQAKTETVVVRVRGLLPNTTHAAHIHLGSCESEGAVKYPLAQVTVGSTGSGTSTTVLHSATPLPKSGLYVNVHYGSASQLVSHGPGPTLYFQPILCGPIG